MPHARDGMYMFELDYATKAMKMTLVETGVCVDRFAHIQAACPFAHIQAACPFAHIQAGCPFAHIQAGCPVSHIQAGCPVAVRRVLYPLLALTSSGSVVSVVLLHRVATLHREVTLHLGVDVA
jgi:hypothetical protein